jgi:hypothetical protein
MNLSLNAKVIAALSVALGDVDIGRVHEKAGGPAEDWYIAVQRVSERCTSVYMQSSVKTKVIAVVAGTIRTTT